MPDFLNQFGTCVDRWRGITFSPHLTEFFVCQDHGSYTAVAWSPTSYWTASYDYYPSRDEVEDYFKGVEEFCSLVKNNEGGCSYCGSNTMMSGGYCYGCYGGAN